MNAKKLATFSAAIAMGCTAMVGQAAAAPAATPAVPNGMTASFIVVDSGSGKATLKRDEHHRYRSASVVKLLIALDYLTTLGPDKDIPKEDLALLQPMLRSSNDDAASTFWVRNGGARIIERMVREIGLTDTAPPPAAQPGVWGYTALSAADIAKIYQYIVDTADSRARTFMLGNLHKYTQCAADGFDQSFGIPSAVRHPGAVKQGWSGFGAAPAPGEECSQPASDDPAETARVLASPEVAHARQVAPAERRDAAGVLSASDGIDLERPAMHTTGTVGDNDDKIVVVLTLEPKGTDWTTSGDRITALTKLVNAAGR